MPMTKTIETLFLILCISVFMFVIPINLAKDSEKFISDEFNEYQINEFAWRFESYWNEGLDMASLSIPLYTTISFFDDSFIYLYSHEEFFEGINNTKTPRYVIIEDANTHYKKGIVLSNPR